MPVYTSKIGEQTFQILDQPLTLRQQYNNHPFHPANKG